MDQETVVHCFQILVEIKVPDVNNCFHLLQFKKVSEIVGLANDNMMGSLE